MITHTHRGPGSTALYAFAREEERRVDSQLEDLQEVADAQGLGLEWYTDWQAKKELGRPAYCTFLQDLRNGRLNWLVVWRLDKLGLNQGGLAELFGELARCNCGFTSLQDNLCIETEILKELPAVLEAAVFSERRLMGVRTAQGQAEAKHAGTKWGGSLKGRVWTVTEEQRAQVAALAAQGRPKALIARQTGLSRSTVYRLVAGKPRRRVKAGGKNAAAQE